MFNNPYLNNYGFPQSYPQFPQPQEKTQPIQNIFTSQAPIGSEYFMAKMLKGNETPETQLVTQKTAFIDLENKKLSIKEINGDIKSYEIILPLDEKDRKIQELENQILQMKGMMSNVQPTDVTTINENTKSTGNAKKSSSK